MSESSALTNDPKPSRQTPKKDHYRTPRHLFFTLVIFLLISVFAFILYSSQDLPPLDQIENPQSNLSTQVISADGEVLQNFYTQENRVNVELHQISPYVIDGLIATEDLRFYQHSGVDYNTFVAIIVRYLRGITSGGSTITMQLSRNLFDAVGASRTVPRKIKEVIVSAILEQKFTKEEILTAYLNTVCIYGQTYGIEMASQRLFGSSAKNLKLEEASVIVAMLKGQGVFNPFRNPDTVIFRRNVVINKMLQQDMLEQDLTEIDSIKSLPLEMAAQGQDHITGTAPYFREHIRQYMKQWCAERGYNLYTDGLKIHTTLDSRLQKHAEAAMEEHLSVLQKTFERHIRNREAYRREPAILEALMAQSSRYAAGRRKKLSHEEIEKQFHVETEMKLFAWDKVVDTVLTPWDSLKYYAKFLETGMVSVDPRNGDIKAWVGGIDYRFFKYDHVAHGKRQVGSTFKPFVYAAALDNGRTPCDEILNQPVFFENVNGDGERWAPKNSDGKVGRKMTLRRGLATSTNLITARLMKDIGPRIVVDYAKKMGITSDLEAVPALCLGVNDLNVMELTGAYGTFANQGLWIEPHFISRIEDRNGNVIQQFIPKTNQALSEQKAYEMMELLKGVVDEPGGTAHRLRFKYGLSAEVGGKTGTTQNHSDGWFVGVTPHLVSGVWVGCADRRMRFNNITLGQGANLALPIWALYMKRLYADKDLNFSQETLFRTPEYAKEDDFVCLSSSDSLNMFMRSTRSIQEEIDGF